MKRTFKIRQSLQIAVLVAFMPMILGVASCKNVFEDSSNKVSDDALLYAATIHANAYEWTEAIAAVNAMSTAGQAKRETKSALASYYAGRCGLDLLGLALGIVDGLSTQKLFPLLMGEMKDSSASQFADCKQAEAILVSVGATAAARTPNENVLLAFIEFAKIGAALASSNADANNDGVMDVGFDGCSTGSIADASVQELGTGLTIATSSLSASGSQAAADAVSVVAALCDAVDTLMGTTDFCDSTDASDFTGPKLLALRALTKSNEVGFNTCSGSIGQNSAGTANDCICPVIP